jgi:DegV family protein with EDD domain
MDNFDIYVDSSANLTEEMIEENDIHVISYTLTVDGKDIQCYEKGNPYKEIAKKFYDAMRNGCETRTTLLNAQQIAEAVAPSMQAGKDVLFITISSAISGTNHQAKLAVELLKEQYPDRKLVVADSYNASLGEGLFAVQAAKLRALGQSVEACGEWIERHKLNMHSEFTVNDLKYLRRGGRISATLAIAGTLLNIKPILRADGNGRMSYSSKERGRKKALAAIADTFAETVINPENQTVAICHADCEEDALILADLIREKGAKDILIQWYDICTGSHVGPGTVALFYMGKERGKSAEVKEPNPNGIKVKVNK